MPKLKIAIQTPKSFAPPTYKGFKISVQKENSTDWEYLIADCLGYSKHSLPIAAIYAFCDGFEANKGSWLCADPVELHLDGGYLMMLGHQHLELSADECQQLRHSLQTFLDQEHIQLHCLPQSKRWYLQSSTTQFIGGTSLRKILGKDIREGLPQSAEGQYERILLTQLQMLLNQHPVNIVRLEQGHSPINSLWLWGGGSLAELPVKLTEQNFQLWTNDRFTQGLANLQNILVQTLPFQINELRADRDQIIVINAENISSLDELMQQFNISVLLKKAKTLGFTEIQSYLSSPEQGVEQHWHKKTLFSWLCSSKAMKKNQRKGCSHEEINC